MVFNASSAVSSSTSLRTRAVALREARLRVRFRKMTGSACVPPKAPPHLRAKQAMPGPLSNPPETINLASDSRAGNRVGHGSPQSRSLRLRRSGGGPIFEVPIRFMDRTGSGDLEKCVAGAFRWLMPEPVAKRPRCALRSPLLEFERLSHVAANLQSLFARAGHVICFCFANEQ